MPQAGLPGITTQYVPTGCQDDVKEDQYKQIDQAVSIGDKRQTG
jgi:hypothetical protein